MQWISCAAAIILFSLVPLSHNVLSRLVGSSGAYALGTMLMLGLVAAIPAVWPPPRASCGDVRPRTFVALTIVFAGITLLAVVAFKLLVPVFAGPLDPNRGDMLVIIEHAIRLFLEGGNPYSIHKVPWDAPLSYGPVLWIPFVVPHLLRIDLRVITLATQFVVPLSLFVAAALIARRGETAKSISLLSLALALMFNPELQRFHAIGHTQIYWPLLLCFTGLLASRRYTAAAVVLGLMVAARTTFVSIVPVFFLFLASSRVLTVRQIAAFVIAAVMPFLPFLIADPETLRYAMFGVYLKLMKGFVWYSTTWTQNTYGLTGRLLERGLERYVELVQVVALLATYAAAWRSLRRGGPPEPWLVISLLVFSMTTLWPVAYLYFDVTVLAACALLARASEPGAAPAQRDRVRNSITLRVAMATAGSLVIVFTCAAIRPGASYTIDVGSPLASGFTGGGFGRDEAIADGARSVVWIEGETARVRLPRAGWRGATIAIAIKPGPSHGGSAQRVAVALNGRGLGMAALTDGWQEIRLTSRSRDWNYGFNVLDLSFSYAAPLQPESGDKRALAAAVDWIAIE